MERANNLQFYSIPKISFDKQLHFDEIFYDENFQLSYPVLTSITHELHILDHGKLFAIYFSVQNILSKLKHDQELNSFHNDKHKHTWLL